MAILPRAGPTRAEWNESPAASPQSTGAVGWMHPAATQGAASVRDMGTVSDSPR
jgi:hypothetical protein